MPRTRLVLLPPSHAARSGAVHALTWMAAAGAIAFGLAGCAAATMDEGLLGIVRPYRLEVVQGNVVTREMLADLREGLSRDQVRGVMGTPLLTDIFHADRWDYVFTIRRQGAQPQQRRVTLFFEGERLARIQAEPLPSEREFVSAINVAPTERRDRPLELSPEELAKLPLPKAAAAPAPDVAASGPQRAYPPLEPVTQP